MSDQSESPKRNKDEKNPGAAAAPGSVSRALNEYYTLWFGINAVYESWAKRNGLTCNSLFTLYVIRQHPGRCTQREICEQLLLPKQTVNAILSGFEKKGYVTKSPVEEDRRNKYLIFTEEGRRYAEALLDELRRFESGAMEQMGPDTRRALVDSSRAFFTGLRSGLPDAEMLESSGTPEAAETPAP